MTRFIGGVTSSKYLGRTLSSSDNDFLVLEQNLQKAQGKWGRLAKILGSEGAERRMTGFFLVAVVQAVLIFKSETWVLNPRFEKSLESFHHHAVRRMAGMGHKHQQDGTWVYTPFGALLATVRLEDIGVYIACRQNKVAQFIAIHPIMELFSSGGAEVRTAPIQAMVGAAHSGYHGDKGGACSSRGGGGG